jgi:hypothetical protein
VFTKKTDASRDEYLHRGLLIVNLS